MSEFVAQNARCSQPTAQHRMSDKRTEKCFAREAQEVCVHS